MMSEVDEKRLEKALEDLFEHVEDMGNNRLVNDIVPVMEAMGRLNPNDGGAMRLLEEALASLEGAKLAVLASVVGLGAPTGEFFDNLDFAEKKVAVALKFIGTLREAGQVKKTQQLMQRLKKRVQ